MRLVGLTPCRENHQLLVLIQNLLFGLVNYNLLVKVNVGTGKVVTGEVGTGKVGTGKVVTLKVVKVKDMKVKIIKEKLF